MERTRTLDLAPSKTHKSQMPIYVGLYYYCTSHWGKKPQFIQKFTFWKSQFWQNSHVENLIFHKIHISKISFFTKFTFPKSHFCRIHPFKISLFTKFTMSKSCSCTKLTFIKKLSRIMVNFVKSEILKMWILWKIRLWKCEFCQNWDFQNVNFVKN